MMFLLYPNGTRGPQLRPRPCHNLVPGLGSQSLDSEETCQKKGYRGCGAGWPIEDRVRDRNCIFWSLTLCLSHWPMWPLPPPLPALLAAIPCSSRKGAPAAGLPRGSMPLSRRMQTRASAVWSHLLTVPSVSCTCKSGWALGFPASCQPAPLCGSMPGMAAASCRAWRESWSLAFQSRCLKVL